MPVLHAGRVFITTGDEPEHGEGPGRIWCIDPTKRGDVSAELVVQADDHKTIIPYDRNLTIQPEQGQVAIRNPNSAVIWKYVGVDQNANGELELHERMHRTFTPVVIDGELLFASDFSGILHCLDVKTGKPHWTHDALAAIWSPPFVADGKVYLADEDGDVAIFYASADPHAASGTSSKEPAPVPAEPMPIEPVREINLLNSCYTQPTASKGVLYIANRSHLFAIQNEP